MPCLPWRFGANFVPSTASNQLEMWQAETFDPDTIDRELGWAAGLGMGIMRVFLHDLLWEQDAGGFGDRIERYLDIAARHDIKTMFVFFDDCWGSEFALGKQPEPVPFVHNSRWVQSPGNRVNDHPAEWGRLENYVRGVLARFGNDPRVAVWDLYNEPGNGHCPPTEKRTFSLRAELSLPLLQAVFAWAKAAAPDKPLTSGIWNLAPEFDALNRYTLENSDVVSFHCYKRPEVLQDWITLLRLLAGGRPMVCTEYMARTEGSTFAECLPILRKNGVSAINWGLVAGRSQTIYPWGWEAAKGQPEKWFHDVFNPDGTLLYSDEAETFAAVRGEG